MLGIIKTHFSSILYHSNLLGFWKLPGFSKFPRTSLFPTYVYNSVASLIYFITLLASLSFFEKKCFPQRAKENNNKHIESKKCNVVQESYWSRLDLHIILLRVPQFTVWSLKDGCAELFEMHADTKCPSL